MCDSQVIRRTRPTLPSLLSILKEFPVQQYVQAGHFYHSNSMRVLFSLTQLGPEHEINLRGAPYELVKTLLVLKTRCDQRRLKRACVFAQSCQGLAH